ncbi:MAG: coenzyme A pyrophosphatase [Rhodospirillaceae bacterium]|nr:MAG: coenzyme A pyrophosphatase [Rhodospirillaceae bacterium]
MKNFDWVRACLQRAPSSVRESHIRGDHDLNPDLSPAYPSQPLRPAAVLIALVDRADGFYVLFTRRTDDLYHHPGQICFPGGHIETSDQDATAAALRETEEEIGLKAKHITILGTLDTYITRTGFSITPVVAGVEPPFDLSPDPGEVADIFEVPLAFFRNPDNHQRLQREFEGNIRNFYAIPYGDYNIWGATAGILVNLYQSLIDGPPPN